MKKIAYTEMQIVDIVNGLGLLSVKGIQQARILTMIAGILDQGKEIIVEEEGGVDNDTGKTD